MTAQVSSAAFHTTTQPAALPEHDATELTAGGHLALITLNGEVYALGTTRQGKLILTN
ncbi:MAG: hemin uptake protein HemP [Alphaproteobacteria bacterium]|nr:hemin uptake protein HemP [Alphaproteobacteria bacterium]